MVLAVGTEFITQSKRIKCVHQFALKMGMTTLKLLILSLTNLIPFGKYSLTSRRKNRKINKLSSIQLRGS